MKTPGISFPIVSVLLSLLCALLLSTTAKAQGDMRFFGTATKEGKPLSGANVSVLMDGKSIINLTTGKNGKFKFTIDLGHQYRINFSAPGCVDMYMMLDLRVPPDKAWIYPDYVTEIPFFSPGDSKIKTELFAQKPFVKVIFDGGAGFHDDPSYRFIDEVFKDPMEEIRKKEAEEKARKDAEERARQEEEERLRNQREAEEELRLKEAQLEEQRKKDQQKTAEDVTPVVEDEAIRLEREKQEKLEREKENKNVRTQYENNLLKLVAESEKKTNIQKFNRMKDDAEVNSVVQALRKQSEVKGQREFLIEKDKEKQRQTRVNRQIRELQVKKLVETAAGVERTMNISAMKPVASGSKLNYIPSPHIVTITRNGFWTSSKRISVRWPGGKALVYETISYWWKTYFYKDDKEILESVYRKETEEYRN